MRKLIGFIFLLIGLFLLSGALYQWSEQQKQSSYSLEIAQERLSTLKDEVDSPLKFEADTDEVIGILTIPKLERSIAIVEGTDEGQLEQGVGHYSTTAFPGQNEQVLLSGHRDTVFREFGELEVGDRFLVEMPYGTFEYEMTSSEIVDADDRTIIRSMGEEVLTLSTCYPFSFIGFAPDRYIIYAYPVKE